MLPHAIKQAGRLGDQGGFLAIAQSDPALEIFHYRKLLQALDHNFARRRIFIKKFEEIVDGELGDLLKLLELPAGAAPPRLPRANQRQEDQAYIHTGKTLTLGDLLRRRCRRPEAADPRARRFALRLCRSLAKRLEIPLRRIKIEKPDAQQLTQLRSFLQPDIDYLAKEYAVDYATRDQA
jgi:hypothetical protein